MKTLILGTASATFLIACGGGDTTVVKEKATEVVKETAAKVTGGDIRVVGSSTV